MKFEHPKVAANQVTSLVSEIGAGLAAYGQFNKPPTEVSPQPCDHVDASYPVSAPVTEDDNLDEVSWRVDYSPYAMMYIGYLDVPSVADLAPAISGLRDRLAAAGWRSHKASIIPAVGGDYARLVVEAPSAGYVATISAITTSAGRPRLAVFVASPCLRHPGEST